MARRCLVAFCSLVASAVATNGGEPSPADLLRQAAVAARAALKSGEGSGVYRHYDPQGKLVGDVTFEVRFRGQCYNLNLHFRRAITDESTLPRRLIVCDSSAIFFRDYQEDSAQGSPIIVLPPTAFHSGSRGFEARLHGTTSLVIRVEDLDKGRLSVERRASGRLRGVRRPKNGCEEVIEAVPEAGYNVVFREGFMNGVRHPWVVDAEWAQDGGVWYVRRHSLQYWVRGKPDIRYEWEYHRFRANPALPDELFSMAAFSLKAGDRILDRRPGPPKIYQVDPGRLQEQKLDTMAAQLEKMPVRGAMVAPPPTSHRLAWTLGIGGGVVAVVALVWRARCRLRRRASGGGETP